MKANLLIQVYSSETSQPFQYLPVVTLTDPQHWFPSAFGGFFSCLPLSCLSVSHLSSCCFLAAPTLPAHASPLCPDSAAPGVTHPPFCPGPSQLPQVLPSHPSVCLAGTGNALTWHIKTVVTLTWSKMMAGRGQDQDRTQHIWYSKIVQNQFHVAKWNSTATRFIFFNLV